MPLKRIPCSFLHACIENMSKPSKKIFKHFSLVVTPFQIHFRVPGTGRTQTVHR